MTVSLSVVIPTTGRPSLSACVDAIRGQVDEIVIVAHKTDVCVRESVTVPYDEDQPNISRMWNLGLDASSGAYVAVLNDDVIVPAGWAKRVTTAMERTGAVIGYASPSARCTRVNWTAGATTERMTGYAWILDQRSGLRLDESMQWWYSDNDIEWRARLSGGVVAVPGRVKHLYPNESTVGVLREQADRDCETFREKWGRLP